jgi:hypothetical protein
VVGRRCAELGQMLRVVIGGVEFSTFGFGAAAASKPAVA